MIVSIRPCRSFKKQLRCDAICFAPAERRLMVAMPGNRTAALTGAAIRSARRRSACRPWRPRRATARPCGRPCDLLDALGDIVRREATGSCAASTMTSPALMPFLRRRACRARPRRHDHAFDLFDRGRTSCATRPSRAPAAGRSARPVACRSHCRCPCLCPCSALAHHAGLVGILLVRRPIWLAAVSFWPLRSTSTSTSLPIGVCETRRGRPRMVVTSLPSNLTITSPASMPAFAAGPSGVTPATSAPMFSLTPTDLGDVLGHATGCVTPSQPRRVSPNCRSWSTTDGGRIGGHGEADADRAAGRRDDRRVHADHLAVHVEQRPARVALVDGGIGLQVVVVGAGVDVALLGRNDADR